MMSTKLRIKYILLDLLKMKPNTDCLRLPHRLAIAHFAFTNLTD